MKLRLWFKQLIVKIGFGAKLIEFCERCGRRQPLIWWADEPIWWEVQKSHAGAYCPECFDHLATSYGMMLRWRPELHPASTWRPLHVHAWKSPSSLSLLHPATKEEIQFVLLGQICECGARRVYEGPAKGYREL